MGKQRGKRFGECSIRLLVCIVHALMFFQVHAFERFEISVSNENSVIGESIDIKILLDKRQYKNILKENNLVALQSQSNFKIVEQNIKEYGTTIEFRFDIKIYSLGENYFYLFINNKKINEVKIKIIVRLAEISPETKFIWKVLDLNQDEVRAPLYTGQKYFLVLYGNFLNVKNHIQKVNYHFSENMLLEENNTVHSELENFSRVISFLFIPLEGTNILLPSVEIFYTDSRSLLQRILIPEEIITVIPTSSETKTLAAEKDVAEKKYEHVIKATRKYSSEDIRSAQEIYRLRCDVNHCRNVFENIKKIGMLEKQLGIEHAFSPYPKIFYAVLTISALLSLLFLFFVFKIKKLPLIFMSIFLLLAALFFFKRYSMQYAVLVSDTELAVKAIPEKNSQNIFLARIGETVIIEKKYNDWYFIKTIDNKRACIEASSILEIK